MKTTADKTTRHSSSNTSKTVFRKPGASSFFAPAVQMKIKVSQPGEKHEQEADAMADKVMRMPEPRQDAPLQRQEMPKEEKIQKQEEEENIQRQEIPEDKVQKQEQKEETLQRQAMPEEEEQVQRQPQEEEEETLQRQEIPEDKIQKQEQEEETLQRQAMPEEEEQVQRQPQEEKETLQRKELPSPEEKLQKQEEEEQIQRKPSGAPTVNSNVHSAINQKTSGGQSMSPNVKSFMESRFNADFSKVKIHNDQGAASLSNRLSAKAFTYKNHIFFSKGQYEPGTSGGKHLLAHELTHVIQQGQAAQRKVQASTTPTQPHVQRLGISDALDFFADKAYLIPGFRMFTIILGVNPINMQSVERSAANILRAIVEFLPGGNLITRVLDKYGVFEKAGTFVEQQIQTLGMTGSVIRSAVMRFLDSLGWSDIFDLGGVWERAKRIFTEPINRIKNFVKGLFSAIMQIIRDAVLRPLASLAEGTRGYNLVKALLAMDPLTGDPYPRTAETIIGGFMELIGQQEVWENIKKGNAVARAWAWFQNALAGLMGFVMQIPTLLINTLRSLELQDFLILPQAFGKIFKAFGGIVGRFMSWAGGTVLSLLEILFSVVAPGAMPYLKRAAGAFQSILRNPIGFVGNLVRAVIQGFRRFASNIGKHLKNSLIEWLTGSLGGAGIHIPQEFSLKEIIKFVLSVLGLTWQNIRIKLVKVLGEPAVKAMEKGVEIVTTLVKEGPAAAWELIKEQLSNLKDMVMSEIMNFVVVKIVQSAVTKLVTSLNPAGAVIQAIIAIYNTIMFLVERIKKIIQVGMAVINSMMEIASGAIGKAAAKVEQTMAGLLTLVISFLARIVGLGKISNVVIKIIQKIRAPIDKAIDKLIGWLVKLARKVVTGVAQAGVPQDPQKRLDLGLNAAVKAVNALNVTEVSEKLINPILQGIKVRYGFQMLKAVEINNEWWIEGNVNPGKKRKTKFSKAATKKANDIAGKNIKAITNKELSPEYTLRTYLGFDEVQASSGYGGKVPVMHVSDTDIVTIGAGPFRSDYVLINEFNTEINKIETDLAALTPPIALQGDKKRPEQDLRNKSKSSPQFAHGIRRQMKEIINFLRGSKRMQFRGVEVPLGGGKSIDFTMVKRERGKDMNALVEIKNWSGTYDPKELNEKAIRLQSQLTSYIDLAKQGANNYDMLILDWYGFSRLDARAQAVLQSTVDVVRNYTKGKILFRFNKL